MKKLEALIFDFDGVIIDTESARFEAWKKIYNHYDQELPKDIWVKSIGHSEYVVNPYDLLAELTGKAINIEDVRAMERRYEKVFVALEPLMSGLLERIQEAKELGAGIAVASSSSRNWVEGHLHDRGIFHLFNATICRGDVVSHKPNPEPYLTALRALGANAARAIAVEDSPMGIQAAVSAGIFCIAIQGEMTKTLDQSKAHLRLKSLQEITFASLLESLVHY